MGEMQEKSDAQLLRDYAECRDEAAFREIVARHTDFVYSAALRQVESSDLAADIAQGVFVDLARKAKSVGERLTTGTSLAGWLHRGTRYAALNHLRDTRRRLTNERQAMEQFLTNSESSVDWEQIRPALDEALDSLGDEDREAVLLRYFKNLDFRAVGFTLGVSDDAAQKRVSRAVEHLREFFTKRGVTVGASGLVVVIAANAVQAAPAGLAATISAAAVLAGTAVSTSTVITATKIIAMTTIQKALITATIAAAVGTGIYEARQTATLRSQVQILQQQQAPLTEQLTQLKTENESLSDEVVQARDAQALSKAQLNELLKLRGKAGVAQADARELARLKSTLAQQTSNTPDYLTNMMAMGTEIGKKLLIKDAQARLARMKKILKLTDDQVQAIGDIMQKHIQNQTQMSMEMMTGKLTPEQQQAMVRDTINQDAEIKALLTPEQLAAYPEYQQAEKITAADNSAKTEAGQITDEFGLSQEQQEQIRASFSQMNLNESDKKLDERLNEEVFNAANKEAISAAIKSGNSADVVNLGVELMKSQLKSKLEEKLKILGSILTSEQINTYREEQMNQIKIQAQMGAQMMKGFLPQKPAGTTN
jgi:RNA polymerase sigma factor (sigma-70 family)